MSRGPSRLTLSLVNACVSRCVQRPEDVVSASETLLNALPNDDLRWAEDERTESSSTPKIILQQLKEKRDYYDRFLKSTVSALGNTLSSEVRWLLCGHMERIQAAIALRDYHNNQSSDKADGITKLLVKTFKSMNLGPRAAQLGVGVQDLFYYEIANLDAFFPAIVKEVKYDAYRLDPSKLLEIELAGHILESLLMAALQYRDSESEFLELFSARNSVANQWTFSEPIRDALTEHYETIHAALSKANVAGHRQVFLQQLATLADLQLSFYWTELEFLEASHPLHVETHLRVYNSFLKARAHFIEPLVAHNDIDMAFALAEKYKHFELLIRLCEELNQTNRLESYVQMYHDDNFSVDLFQWYLDHQKLAKLLRQPPSRWEALSEFLKGYPEYSWMHEINHIGHSSASAETLLALARNETQFLTKRKTLLSLCKLAALVAKCSGIVEEVENEMWFIQVQELLLIDAKYAETVERFRSREVDPSSQYFDPLALIDAFIGDIASKELDAIDLAIALEVYARSETSRSKEENKSVLVDICVKAVLKDNWKAFEAEQNLNDKQLEDKIKATKFYELATLFDTQELLFQKGVKLPDVASIARGLEAYDSDQITFSTPAYLRKAAEFAQSQNMQP